MTEPIAPPTSPPWLARAAHLYDRTLVTVLAIALAVLATAGALMRLALAANRPWSLHLVDVALVGAVLAGAWLAHRRSWRLPAPHTRRMLLIAGCVLRLLVLGHDLVDRPEAYSDYLVHEELGQRLAFEHAYYEPRPDLGGDLRTYRPFGVPLLMAPFYLVFGVDAAPLVLYHALSFGLLGLWYLLLRPAGNGYAWLALAYVALSPNMALAASFSNTQLPFFFVLTLLLLLVQRARATVGHGALVGLLVAALVAMRLYLPVGPPLGVLALERWGWRRGLLRWAGVAALVAVVAYSPWVVRNYRVFDRFYPFFSAWGMYQAVAIDDVKKAGGYSGNMPAGFFETHPVLDELQWKADLDRAAFAWIREHPGRYALALPFRAAAYMGNQSWCTEMVFDRSQARTVPWLHTLLGRIDLVAFWAVVGAALLGWLRRPATTPFGRFLVAQYLLYTAILVPLFECWARYHFPFFLLPLLALALGRAQPDRVATDPA